MHVRPYSGQGRTRFLELTKSNNRALLIGKAQALA